MLPYLDSANKNRADYLSKMSFPILDETPEGEEGMKGESQTCLRCGYTWVQKLEKSPRVCPNPHCHSKIWMKPKEVIVGLSHQICSKCGVDKNIEEFKTRDDCIRGRRKVCNACLGVYSKEYRDSHKADMAEYTKLHYLKNKSRILERTRTYQQTHKAETRVQKRKYRILNADRIYKTRRAYLESPVGKIATSRIKHTRNSREFQSPCTLTLDQWNKILEMQHNKCAVCEKSFNKTRPATKDHIIPLSKGGGLTFENVQALCQSCNSKKHDKLDHSLIVSWGAVPP